MANAADLQVIAGGGIAGALNPIAAAFEKASGHKVTVRYGTTPELIAMAKSAPFDAVVLPREFLDDAEAAAKLAGAPKPDIASPEALKQALLEAKSVGTVPASAAGAQVMKLFERLGVAAREATQAELARAFITFLQAPAAKALITSRGLTSI